MRHGNDDKSDIVNIFIFSPERCVSITTGNLERRNEWENRHHSQPGCGVVPAALTINYKTTNEMDKLKSKTECQYRREQRDMAILKEYHAILAKNPEQSRTELYRYLGAKYNLSGQNSIYAVVKRMERRQQVNA